VSRFGTPVLAVRARGPSAGRRAGGPALRPRRRAAAHLESGGNALAAWRDGDRAADTAQHAIGHAPSHDPADAPAVGRAHDEPAGPELASDFVQRASCGLTLHDPRRSAESKPHDGATERRLRTVAHQRIVAGRDEPCREFVYRMGGDDDDRRARDLSQQPGERQRRGILTLRIDADDDGLWHGGSSVGMEIPCRPAPRDAHPWPAALTLRVLTDELTTHVPMLFGVTSVPPSARTRVLPRLAALAALALAVVLAAALAGPSGEQPRPAADAAVEARLFDGIPQDGIALGSPAAPAVLIEFADLQCPFCADYARDVLPIVVERYVRPGRLRLELHVLSFLGEDSIRAGSMAAAASQQDRLWPFVDGFYRHQGRENSGYATDDFLRRIGELTPGLAVRRALADRSHPPARRRLAQADAAARSLGTDHTPAFFLRHGGGPARPLGPPALTPDAFTAALDEALSAR
jgi:protein-disulfide isomerase